jgi:hypothetical protein
LPNLGVIPGGQYLVGDLTILLAPPSFNLFVGTGNSTSWTGLLSGNQIGISDTENLNIDLANPVFAFGFDFVEPENDPTSFINAPFVDSTFQVRFLNNGLLVDTFIFNAPNDVAAFFSVWGDVTFDRVEIREIVGGIENEFFGEFYTGTAPLPEPSTLIGLGTVLGVGVLYGWRRRPLRKDIKIKIKE